MIVLVGTYAAGGLGAVIDNVKDIPGFLEFFGMATPQTVDGVQQAADGVPLFGEAAPYGLISVVSMLAWGLGYFGVPQVLLRFMAIRHEDELTRSRRIATVMGGDLSGHRGIYRCDGARPLSDGTDHFFGCGECIYPSVNEPSAAADRRGFVMAGILAATISSSDSYLLIASVGFCEEYLSGAVPQEGI